MNNSNLLERTESANAGSLHPVVRCAVVSEQLAKNLQIVKRLLGDKWESASKEYRVILLAVMAANGETNPLAVATPMAKRMSNAGHNPLMLLATATEMASTPNTKLSD